MAKKANQEKTPEVKEYERIHNSSFRDLVKQEREKTEDVKTPSDESTSDTTTTPSDDTTSEDKAEVKLTTPEEETQRADEQKKRDEELQAIKESTKTLQDYVKEIKESQMSKEEKKEAIKELKANWTGKDTTTGQATPKDWEEVIAENLRLSKEQTMELLKEQFNAFREEIKKQEEEEKTATKAKEDEQKNNYELAEKKVAEEMEELYQAGKFVKPKDLSDRNDPAVKKIEDLFVQLNNFNSKRMSEGQPPYDSISRFALLYYKPSEAREVAGADAPISGATTPIPENESKVSYNDIHNLSFRQLIKKIGGK